MKHMLKQRRRISRIAVAFLLVFWLTPTLANAGSSIETKTDFGKFQVTVTSKSTGASAICNDGTFSYSQHRQGTCSWHNGVRQWCPCGGGDSTYTTTPASAAAFCVSLSSARMSYSEIRLMQVALFLKGFNPGPFDGIFGNATSYAIKRYEIAYGIQISPNRRVYLTTLMHLNIDC